MRVILTIFCCLLSFSSWADEMQTISQILAQTGSQGQAISGQFEQTKRMRILNQPLVSQGRFVVVKNLGVFWQLEKPFASTMTISAKGLQGAGIENNLATQYVGKLLMQILSGDLSALKEQFALSSKITGNHWQLSLVPHSALMKKAILSIEMSGDQYIQKVELEENGGNSTAIRFFNQVELEHVPGDILDALHKK